MPDCCIAPSSRFMRGFTPLSHPISNCQSFETFEHCRHSPAGAFFSNLAAMLLLVLIAQSWGLLFGGTFMDPKSAQTITTVVRNNIRASVGMQYHGNQLELWLIANRARDVVWIWGCVWCDGGCVCCGPWLQVMLTFLLVGGFYVRDVPVWIGWIKYVSFVYWGYNLLCKIQFRGMPTLEGQDVQVRDADVCLWRYTL